MVFKGKTVIPRNSMTKHTLLSINGRPSDVSRYSIINNNAMLLFKHENQGLSKHSNRKGVFWPKPLSLSNIYFLSLMLIREERQTERGRLGAI